MGKPEVTLNCRQNGRVMRPLTKESLLVATRHAPALCEPLLQSCTPEPFQAGAVAGVDTHEVSGVVAQLQVDDVDSELALCLGVEVQLHAGGAERGQRRALKRAQCLWRSGRRGEHSQAGRQAHAPASCW